MLKTINSLHKTKFRICDSIKLETGVTIPCIQGQVGSVGVISQNGYRYKEDFWDKVLSDSYVQNQIRSREMLGCIEHPTDDDAYLCTPYDKASHVVIKAWTENHNPYAILGLMNNEQGNIIKSLVEVGHRPGVSTRGLGQMETDSTSEYVSEDGYCLLGWDLVKNPNFSDLKMDACPVSDSLRKSSLFVELCDANRIKDSADEHYNKEHLLQDMNRLISELQAKIQKFELQ